MKTRIKRIIGKELRPFRKRNEIPSMIECQDCGLPHGAYPLTLIECVICGNAAYSPLDYAEVEALLSFGSISRRCYCCDATTRWKQFDSTTEALFEGKGPGEGLPRLIFGSSCN